MFDEIADHAAGIVAICDYTGFERAPWVRRVGAAHCIHQGYFHISSGVDFARQVIVGGHYRTADFVTVERAIEPINVLPVTFGEMASFDGKLWRANGLWDYPFSVAGSHCTNKVFESETGSIPWALDAGVPPGSLTT